jgi:hypothetical protein
LRGGRRGGEDPWFTRAGSVRVDTALEEESNMKLRSFALSVVSLGALLAGVSFALRQDEGAMAMPQVEAGPEHEVLSQWVGTWDAKVLVMGMESKGTYTAKLGMNDLWLVEDYEGEMMGAQFTGHGLLGYDPDKKEYLSVWVDSMTTTLEPSRGTYDKEKKELTMQAKGTNPMTGAEMTMKSVMHIADRDHMTFTMVMPGPDGKDAPTFTIEYTRKK